MSYRDEILKLRSEGLVYSEIANKLGCSTSTVSYYCGKGQKIKTLARSAKRRKRIVIASRVEHFQYEPKLTATSSKAARDKVEKFQRLTTNESVLCRRKNMFKWKDVINKFGWITKCHLTGEVIDLREPETYHFDHIVPRARGGSNDLDNLGVALKRANQSKRDMTVDEYVELCKKVLEHHGHDITKR